MGFELTEETITRAKALMIQLKTQQDALIERTHELRHIDPQTIIDHLLELQQMTFMGFSMLVIGIIRSGETLVGGDKA